MFRPSSAGTFLAAESKKKAPSARLFEWGHIAGAERPYGRWMYIREGSVSPSPWAMQKKRQPYRS